MSLEGHVLWAIGRGLQGGEPVATVAGGSVAHHTEHWAGKEGWPGSRGSLQSKLTNKQDCLNPSKRAGKHLCRNRSPSPRGQSRECLQQFSLNLGRRT